MLIRREHPSDAPAIRAVTTAAFREVPHSAAPVDPDGAPGEATLVGWLRDDPGWVPELSLVAESAPGPAGSDTSDTAGPTVVGHVVASRGLLAGRPALGLGPLSVHPSHQRLGTGSALMHALLGAADAMGEPVVVLLGDPAYYSRFGFVPAGTLGIDAPDPAWGDYFQARALSAWDDGLTGRFAYAAPFDRL
ncbi:GNAT family N-acetyltransferase [Isoptericola cucumis]|uniref:N-acetyltransferase n=1 Tax=Isoptericola cucumis TaxID=1776856 RepID=A0ABQ2B586_9MICO|nr:N-acetyltransferase [Isoptericola cucumis]GGI06273.1 N-acetyltransferase [Isoptericola cucumis]